MSKTKPQIFVIQDNFSSKTEALLDIINSAAAKADATVFRVGEIKPGENFIEGIGHAMTHSELLIADITDAGPNLMHEIGYAQAQNRPIILMASTGRSIPFNLAGFRVLIYDLAAPAEFVERLAKAIRHALKNQADFILSKSTEGRAKRHNVFISYSHSDQEYLDRLLVHLKPLERDGLIDLWADTKLRAGDRWKIEIERALGKATVAVLMVSADFLSSDFIVNNELPPLLRRAEENGTRIIPLIVKPCRFTRDQNLKHFQAVNDPKDALIRVSVGEQESIYDQVALEIEQTLSRI